MKVFSTLLVVIASLALISAGGYGGSSIPSPPCPKNYLFSCQPSLAPAPCALPAAGSVGAYSENIPTILNAPQHYHGLPQQYLQVPHYYGHH